MALQSNKPSKTEQPNQQKKSSSWKNPHSWHPKEFLIFLLLSSPQPRDFTPTAAKGLPSGSSSVVRLSTGKNMTCKVKGQEVSHLCCWYCRDAPRAPLKATHLRQQLSSMHCAGWAKVTLVHEGCTPAHRTLKQRLLQMKEEGKPGKERNEFSGGSSLGLPSG